MIQHVSGDWFDQQNISTAPTAGSQKGPTADQTPSWLPAGATLNPDGSITMADGRILPLPQGGTRDPNTGQVSFNAGTAPPLTGTTDPTTGATSGNNSAYGLQPAPSATGTSGSDPISQFQSYLAKHPDDPQAAIDEWNAAGDPGGLKPMWQPSTKTIGIQGNKYLVMPGTGANPAGGSWQVIERPGQEGGNGSAAQGSMAAPSPITSTFTPQTYKLPTLDELRATPGYQFASEQGNKALQQSQAARGNLLGGGAVKEAIDYNQGLADTTYQNAVGNSLNAFGANANQQQFGANFGLAANQQGFGQNLATNQFNLGQQGQFWNQGLLQNENAFNQYNTNQNTTFDQAYKIALLGNPGNPFA